MRRVIKTAIITTLVLLALAMAAFFLYPVYAARTWAPELRAAAKGCDRMVIKTGGPCHPNPDSDVIRFETKDTNVVNQVLQKLDAASETGVMCRCCGSPTIYFYKGEEVLAAVSMHHRASLRWYRGGHSDVQPSSESMGFILAFFKEHGVQDADIR